MLRRLVVPLDGSELAERALPYAVQLARARGGRLVLVRVALASTPTGFDWEPQYAASVREAEQYLTDVVEKLGPSVPVETASVRYGRPVTEIINIVAEVEADGVVMATHGRTGVAHLLYGSVAEMVLAASPVPVFLVHAQPGQAAPVPFDPHAARLLVPLDGSPFAEEALPAAIDALGPSGELILVRVVAPAEQVVRDEQDHVVAYLDQVQDALEREASDYLQGVVRQVERDHPGTRVRIDVRVGKPADGIATAAAVNLAHLIVMSTHGRTGLRRAVLGSVAGAALRTSHTPVLLVHPHPEPPPIVDEQDLATVTALVSL
jgi:nucleotide-binding universal stress UspA family protein